jgi:two-component system, NarL family, nitrate/nitrite response regulator NarL
MDPRQCVLHTVLMRADSGNGERRALTVVDVGVVRDARALADELCALADDGQDVPLSAWWITVKEVSSDSLAMANEILFKVRFQNELDALRSAPDRVGSRTQLLIIGGQPGSSLLGSLLTERAMYYRSRRDGGVAARPAGRAEGGGRPLLSARERDILLAYASGLTLEAAARLIGVQVGTAKTYLRRVKEKYHKVGRPARTKLELAARAREDWG